MLGATARTVMAELGDDEFHMGFPDVRAWLLEVLPALGLDTTNPAAVVRPPRAKSAPTLPFEDGGNRAPAADRTDADVSISDREGNAISGAFLE